MAAKSAIEWTQSTWNPVRGCTRVSEGCKFCYAERIAARFSGEGLAYEGLAKMTKAGPRWTNKVRLVEDLLDAPLKWKKPQLIFVNSMSDLFHEDVPLDFILRVFETMHKAEQHHFQVLTKRSKQLVKLNNKIQWPKNVWMGVSVENEDYKCRIDDLRETDAHVKFLSLEPLIGELRNLNLTNIDWVIVGGESGPGARTMQEEWVLDIRDQCQQAFVPFFFKQWGGRNKKRQGRELEKKTWDSLPLAYSAVSGQ
ncbi:MAG: phage Gp37/Gp68 family protein [Candidatus Poribacteria bacterium]|nr:phage Gp37/Gp68 family protein [Candidatus Poribacteria bacterium]